jgi:hypothetical protein
MNALKIYDIVVNMTDDVTGVGTISLVEHPAVEVGFLKFEDQQPIQLQFNEDKHIITGIAMLADTPIYRNNERYGEHYVVFSKKTIQTIAEKYAKWGLQNLVNIEHDSNRYVDNVFMIESYFIDKERGIIPSEFTDAPDGSWVVSFKVNNLAVWEDIKANKVKGFSIEGMFEYGETVEKQKHEAQEKSFEEWLNDLLSEIENS